MTPLQPGFYAVRIRPGEPKQIAEYTGHSWFIPGPNQIFYGTPYWYESQEHLIDRTQQA